MNNRIHNFPLFLSFIFYLFSFSIPWSCAAIQAPSGGDVDTIPPELVSVIPPSGTVRFEGGKIQMTFTEYLDENSLKRGIRIFPSMGRELPMKFQGEKITVLFPDTLDTNQTYVIILGRELKDEHGVGFLEPVNLAYSTGYRIDRGEIKGQVFGGKDLSVHLWKLKEQTMPDSLFFTLPDYITDLTDDGLFQFQYLKEGTYGILTLDRASSGLPLDPVRTRFGLPWVHSVSVDTLESIPTIHIRVRDQQSPMQVVGSDWVSPRWGRIYFNNSLEMDSLSLDVIIMIGESVIQHPLWFVDPEDSHTLNLVLQEEPVTETIQIQIRNLQMKDEVLLQSTQVTVQVPETSDTLHLELTGPEMDHYFQPEPGSGPPLPLKFSKPVKLDKFADYMEVLGPDSQRVEITVAFPNPMLMEIEPTSGWDPDQAYSLKLNREGFVSIDGHTFRDSIVTRDLETGSLLRFGGLSGILENTGDRKLIAELIPVENPTKNYRSVVNLQARFEFNDLPEGLYSLIVFEDQDGNGTYSYGTIVPYEPAEWFYHYQGEVEIRANWEIEIAPLSVGIEP